MVAIDKALQKNPFGINEMQCLNAARIIAPYKIIDEATPWSSVGKDRQLAFKVAFVSVCHKINWDYFQNRLAEVLLSDPSLNIPEFLSQVEKRDIERWLHDYPKQERVRGKERAALLRDIGKEMLKGWGVEGSSNIADNGSTPISVGDFKSSLDRFESYRQDPLRKKSNVLIHDLMREQIIEFSDPQKVEPAVDYHIIRIYLRSGRVYPTSNDVLKALKDGLVDPRDRLMILLRSSVSEAAKLTAQYAKLSVPDINYIEWQLGRNICQSSQPKCQSLGNSIDLPADIEKLVSGNCPYSHFCEALNDSKYGFLTEPDVSNRAFY